MSAPSGQQWLRKAGLVVAATTGEGIDLSELQFKFRISQSDEEMPNTATIRVYNLSAQTIKNITGKTPVEYSRVIVQAGYQDSGYGMVFDGTIKQFRLGKESAIDTYLDILAASGDVEYNFGVVNKTLTQADARKVIAETADGMGLAVAPLPDRAGVAGLTFGGTLPRGKVLWGLGRSLLRTAAMSNGWSWTINNGKVLMLPLDGYAAGEAVVLNSNSGMIGIPEQTDQGIKVRCLLNPRIQIGGRVKIDNKSINQTIAQASNQIPIGQLPYDQRAGLTMLADVSMDGDYFVYVVEHSGNTRGNDWYSELICLAIDRDTQRVKPYG